MSGYQDYASLLEMDDNWSVINSCDTVVISRFVCYEIIYHVNLFSNCTSCFARFRTYELPMGLQASVIPNWFIVCEVSTRCSVHVHLSNVHQPVAKILQDAVVICYLGFTGRQVPELLQLQAVEF